MKAFSSCICFFVFRLQYGVGLVEIKIRWRAGDHRQVLTQDSIASGLERSPKGFYYT